MNNAIRTILVILTALAGIMTSVAGCVTDAAGATVCSATWIPPQYATYAVMAFSAIGLAMKALRPGGWFSGLFGQTAVVVSADKTQPGTVTPAQVASHS